jgi:hypothetical protein
MRASVFALMVSMVALTGCGASPPDPPRTTPHLEDVAWLLGTWQSQDDEPAGERWARGAHGFVGSGYVIPPAACAESEECTAEPVETESLELIERDGALIYIATPRTQERTEFVITELDAAHFVAENPEHDFPTRIEYRRTTRGVHVVVSSSERSFALDLFGP